ncbi:DUF4331 family protein [Hyalangium minutum]|uniref:Lipoprotein n=1 Tax=Hyalangium minutum TaxID=394096 RepID=A0A085WMN5_9BACT|nr:hypothetical protein DB31_6850 [Hyalangium minutum]
MKRILKMALYASLLMPLAACKDDDEEPPDNQPPPVPTLGTLIDRMGRPAINAALIGTFEADANTTNAAKDSYNVSLQASWSGYSANIASSLSILDGLDAQCGNQLLAGPTDAAGRYNTLAGVLAEDQLYVNTASTTCGQYLAVEANAVNVVPNNDCGGRAPNYDVIDTSFSVLAAGVLTGVTDGINADGDGNIHSHTAFPFLAAPR